ncbi:MAG: peptide-methionine (S)-S-oxide reductase MsrA [Betaproteobacteria bacterium]|nr:peptide-methionine (S)-S-oxide reductase MsrA [Betaproteobacteria bacterium]MBU6511653.1 peptide-methionine (S)-S-oxide reductase MsrA [Betaproteobacteria bacterium]MDE1956295.1 peptide-methionine (S)-S-oxide reductase MsrA [Betaproteobacteria bacterium]MDE2151641.1 peptide-methionine (S)-S-oxide reductase MsrA [Betaproteobacteria bacterium]
MEQTAILAGGCFWGMQELLRRVPGVLSTRVGYCGGDTANATYRNHGRHAEAVEVRFDPGRVSFRDVLKVFFQIHDPTTRDRQGNDVGSSYRSAILYLSPEQHETARQLIARMDASGVWPGPIVTELRPAGTFWPAEPEHQDYLARNPMGYTCHYPRPDWTLPEEDAEPLRSGRGT